MTLPIPLVRYDFRKLTTDSKNYIVPFDDREPKPTFTHSLKLRRLFQKYETQENKNERIMSENFIEGEKFKEKTILDGIDESFDESMLPCPAPAPAPCSSLEDILLANASEKEYKPYCNTISPIADVDCYNIIYKTVKKDEETLCGPLKLENKYMYQLYDNKLNLNFSEGFTISFSFDLSEVSLEQFNGKRPNPYKRLQFYHLGLYKMNQLFYQNNKLFLYKGQTKIISFDLKEDLKKFKNITVIGKIENILGEKRYFIEIYLDYIFLDKQDITELTRPLDGTLLSSIIFQNYENDHLTIGGSNLKVSDNGSFIGDGVFGGTILDFVIFTEPVDINLLNPININLELNYTLNLLNKKYQKLIQDQEKILANENQHAITLRASENVKNRIQRLRKQTKQLRLASQITHYVLIVIILLVLVYQIS